MMRVNSLTQVKFNNWVGGVVHGVDDNCRDGYDGHSEDGSPRRGGWLGGHFLHPSFADGIWLCQPTIYGAAFRLELAQADPQVSTTMPVTNWY